MSEPTEKMISAGVDAFLDWTGGFGDDENAVVVRKILSAALSVPPAEVVGEPEPIGYCSEYGLDKLASKAHHYCLSVSKTQENEFQFPIYAAPSAPEGIDEQALDKAARECYAVRCKTHGPRVLDQYASPDIMRMQLDDARVIVSAYLDALSVPAAAVVGEPVGYLFEMHYGNGRWSGTMFAEAINIPPEDVRNVRPLYAALGGASHE